MLCLSGSGSRKERWKTRNQGKRRESLGRGRRGGRINKREEVEEKEGQLRAPRRWEPTQQSNPNLKIGLKKERGRERLATFRGLSRKKKNEKTRPALRQSTGFMARKKTTPLEKNAVRGTAERMAARVSLLNE